MKPRWIGQALVPSGCYVQARTTRGGALEMSVNADGCWNEDGPVHASPLMQLDRRGVEGLMALLNVSHAGGVEGLMELLRDTLAAMDGKEPRHADEYDLWNQLL